MHKVDERQRYTAKYKCIEASIKELGVIEPLVVFPQANSQGAFILLDGHIRLAILKELNADLGQVPDRNGRRRLHL